MPREKPKQQEAQISSPSESFYTLQKPLVPASPPAAPIDLWSGGIDALKVRIGLIQRMLKEVFIEGEDYGKVPGCGDKPALLKSGAEKLCLVFHLAPMVEQEVIEISGDHREYRTVVTLYHAPTGTKLGQGIGIGSTKESKHRYRFAKLRCPKCGEETINHSKDAPGWYCWFKIGGCGAKFNEDDPGIKDQPRGKVENPDPADMYNTCAKMSKKRALVDATLTTTGASHLLTQDIEELADGAAGASTGGQAQEQSQKQTQAPQRTAKTPATQPPAVQSASAPTGSGGTGKAATGKPPAEYVADKASAIEGGMVKLDKWCREKFGGKGFWAAKNDLAMLAKIVSAWDSGEILGPPAGVPAPGTCPACRVPLKNGNCPECGNKNGDPFVQREPGDDGDPEEEQV